MKRVMFDLAALIVRIVIGVIFVAHGLQKWQGGLGAVSKMMGQSGVPLPQLAAAFTATVETVGGILLIIGLLVRPAAVALLVVLGGAFVFVHRGHGILSSSGGWELVGALGSVCLLLLVLGGGRASVDQVLTHWYRRKAEHRHAAQETAGASAGAAPAAPTRAAPVPPAESQPAPPTQPMPRSTPAEDTTAPRQHPPDDGSHRPGNLSDQDMSDLDALFNDEHRKPPNR
ncbi:DoxX family protein [Nonomuraea sp. 3-1Str]|uniref:DoxX family protein n=1 Tax=Nonomuraea sp. 3-1Str TaxID=2929801 RepID=UPI00285592F3|nr:DoxX family protein [Nonomuraea sp. 3-1Str]MDR8408339.1 DoxX family protein [Nonomuraea sp. 3-1Str]